MENEQQSEQQSLPLTPVSSSSAGCLVDTFALCGVGSGGGSSGGTDNKSSDKKQNSMSNNEDMNGTSNTNAAAASAATSADLTGNGVANMSLNKDGAAAAINTEPSTTTDKQAKAAAKAAADNGSGTCDRKEDSSAAGQQQQCCAYSWAADRVDFARRCTLRRYDDKEDDEDEHEESEGDNDSEEQKTAAAASASTPTRTKSAPLAATTATPSSNTKVKRKSSTLGGLTSSFGSRRSSATAQQRPTPKKELPGQPIPSTSWGYSSATKFNVRSGPNYAKNGLKRPSLESLYDVVCVRMFTASGQKTTGGTMADTLPLAEEVLAGLGGNDGDGNTSKLWSDMDNDGNVQIDPSIPDVLIFHAQMPHNPPSMFKAEEDGPGEEAVVYLRPSPRFISEVTGRTPMSPATRLFVKWCRTADRDLAMRSRFKCMALVRNLEAHNLGWVAPYNGKPVLITESGQCRKGVLKGTVGGRGGGQGQGGISFLEMTADVFKWGFLAKKGFVTLLPKFKELRLDIGFTIEGKTDEELPECMLGSFVANFCDEGRLEKIPTEMQRPV